MNLDLAMVVLLAFILLFLTGSMIILLVIFGHYMVELLWGGYHGKKH